MEVCVCVWEGRDTFVMCFSYLAFPFYLPALPAACGGVRREGGEASRVLNGFFSFLFFFGGEVSWLRQEAGMFLTDDGGGKQMVTDQSLILPETPGH